MNVRRFTARSSRDALVLVRQALGDDAVVLSTQPCAEGVEVLAMSPASIEQIQRYSASQGASSEPAKVSAPKFKTAASPMANAGQSNAAQGSVASDVERLSMSTLSFQDYVRERMLRRRSAALKSPAAAAEVAASVAAYVVPPQPPVQASAPVQASLAQGRIEPVMPNTVTTVRAPANFREPPVLRDEIRNEQDTYVSANAVASTQVKTAVASAFQNARPTSFQAQAVVPSLVDGQPAIQKPAFKAPAQTSFLAPAQIHTQAHTQAHAAAPQRDQHDMMIELRAMKGLIEDRFDTLAFVDKLQRQPAHARLAQRLLDCGFSPALIRKLTDGMGAEVTDEAAWVSDVLERNLRTAEGELPLEDQGGVYALIGSTGVGKTTSTAKLAAAFASKHGAMHLGLITLDAYRIGAHEQLRTYGRILGVPVHTAHDRASLEDLLELLSAKKMVLIDTAGMAQRDSRTRELLDMLSHRSIQKLLVINAAAQGETTEDVLLSYRASQAKGIVLSKLDEAVKLGPAIDALIRHKLPVTVVANGQRVPEDWHRLSGHALVQRALRPSAGTAYRIDASDVNLIFAATQGPIAVREASQATREATRAAGELLHTHRPAFSEHPFAEHAHA
jgi:flagellar biosynthesis protein FlhF